MRCARCHRQMDKATVWVGGMPIGPTCAQIMGLTDKSQGRITLAITRQHAPRPQAPNVDQLELELMQ